MVDAALQPAVMAPQATSVQPQVIDPGVPINPHVHARCAGVILGIGIATGAAIRQTRGGIRAVHVPVVNVNGQVIR